MSDLVNGAFYWIKDERGGSFAKREPARYVSAYKTASGDTVHSRFVGCGGDAYPAVIGPMIEPPKEIEQAKSGGSMTFLSGLRNCHIHGLNSYVIRERVSDTVGMLRIFHNTGHRLRSLTGDQDYRLAPHNHRQDITLYGLFGSAANVALDVDRLPHRGTQFEYVFGSALQSGEFTLDFKDTVGLFVKDAQPLPKCGLKIPATEVHTVVAAPDSAWLVAEGTLAPATHHSLCYSKRHDFKLKNDGLYVPMTAEELQDAVRLFDSGMMDIVRILEAVCV